MPTSESDLHRLLLENRTTALRLGCPSRYDARKEAVMIELSEEQKQAISSGEAVRLRDNGQEFVVLRADLYDRLIEEEYDDSPWTPQERDALAWEAGKHAGWEEMDEYDDTPETP
jgi:hypothetical protein